MTDEAICARELEILGRNGARRGGEKGASSAQDASASASASESSGAAAVAAVICGQVSSFFFWNGLALFPWAALSVGRYYLDYYYCYVYYYSGAGAGTGSASMRGMLALRESSFPRFFRESRRVALALRESCAPPLA